MWRTTLIATLVAQTIVVGGGSQAPGLPPPPLSIAVLGDSNSDPDEYFDADKLPVDGRHLDGEGQRQLGHLVRDALLDRYGY